MLNIIDTILKKVMGPSGVKNTLQIIRMCVCVCGGGGVVYIFNRYNRYNLRKKFSFGPFVGKKYSRLSGGGEGGGAVQTKLSDKKVQNCGIRKVSI